MVPFRGLPSPWRRGSGLAILSLLTCSLSAAELRGRLVGSSGPLAGVSATVVPADAPVAEAGREAREDPPPRPVAAATSAGDGSFTLALPSRPGADWLRVELRGPGISPERSSEILSSVDDADLGELELRTAHRVEGQLLDERGAPLAGARLTLWGPARTVGRGSLEPLAVTSRTASDGSFRLDGAGAAGNQLRIEAPGRATLELLDVKAGRLPRAVRLQAGRVLTGRVLEADGRTPAASALVRFEGRGATRWVEAGPDGAFVLDGAAPVAGLVRVEAGERGRVSVAVDGRGSDAGTLRLEPGAVLRGRVVDAASGSGIPRARVVAEAPGGSFVARTDREGRYQMAALPVGPVSVRVDHPQFVSWKRLAVVLTTGSTTALDAPLSPGAALRGRVVDEDGRPVAGALLSLAAGGGDEPFRRSRPSQGPPFRSAPDGTFRVERLLPQGGLVLSARHPDFAPARLAGLGLQSGRTAGPFTLVLTRGLTLRGRAIDQAGAPVSGARVDLARVERSPDGSAVNIGTRGGSWSQATTVDGRFEVAGLQPGEFQLTLSAEGFVRERREGLKLGPQGLEALEIRMLPGASISGTLRTESGEPVSGLLVLATAPGTASSFVGLMAQEPTPPDGSFVLDGLVPGQPYDLQVVSESTLGPRKTGVVAPARGLEIVVPAYGRIVGTVLDEEARPVRDFEVSYQEGANAPSTFRMSITRTRGQADVQVPVSDALGRFTIEDVPAGTWDVYVEAPSHPIARAADVRVEAGQAAQLQVRMERGLGLAGRVLARSDGRPIAGAEVEVLATGGAGRLYNPDRGGATSDADGRFELGGLAPGSYTVTARHRDWAEASESVSVGEESPAPVELRLAHGASVVGQVTSGGRPMAGATVTLSADGGRGHWYEAESPATSTDEDGRFAFEHLKPGRHTARARLGGRRSEPVEAVLVGPDARQSIALQLPSGATLRGHVRGLDESERSRVVVSASGAAGPSGGVGTTPDGAFELNDLAAGPLTLTARAGGFGEPSRTAQAQTTLAEAQTEATLDVVFERGLRLEGRVLRAERPVAQAWVTAWSEDGQASSDESDEDGAYELRGLRPGPQRVTVASPEGRASVEKRLTLDNDTILDLVLPEARLAGVVVEADTQRPLSDARVQVEDPRSGRAVGWATTDNAGRFAVRPLEPRPYRLNVRHGGHRVELRELVADADSEVTLELERAEGLGVEALDGLLGTPLSQLWVRALAGSGAGAFSGGVPLDSGGRGSIPGLPSGSYELRAQASGYAPVRLRGVAVPGSDLSLRLTPGGTVELRLGPQTLGRPGARGRLLDASGAPYLPSAFADDPSFVLTGPLVRMTNVTPGGYTLVLEEGSRFPLDVREGQLLSVALP